MVRAVIGQVLLSAKIRGIKRLCLNEITFRYWLEDAKRRNLPDRSIANYINQMRTFVLHTSGDAKFYGDLSDERERHLRLAKGVPSEKKMRQHSDGLLTQRQILDVADKLLLEAPLQRDIRSVRLYYRAAGLFGLLAYCAIRVLDCIIIEMGTHLSRSNQRWSINYRLSKTGEEIVGPLPIEANKYLDAAVCFGGLQGGDEVFWRRYKEGYGQFFFRHPDGSALTTYTLRKMCQRFLNRSPHDLRSTPHDELAREGWLGSRTAKAMCGQRSPQTARQYEVRASETRMNAASTALRAKVEAVMSSAASGTSGHRIQDASARLVSNEKLGCVDASVADGSGLNSDPMVVKQSSRRRVKSKRFSGKELLSNRAELGLARRFRTKRKSRLREL